MGAIYELEGSNLDLGRKDSFHDAVKKCILDHPFLCVRVVDGDVDKRNPSYQRVSRLDIDEDHLIVAKTAMNDSSIESIVEAQLQQDKWRHPSPPWTLHITPLEPNQPGQKRFFAAYVYSHVLGDGMSGLAFHRTFLRSLQAQVETENASSIIPPKVPLPAPFDTPSRLSISWSFLLAPFLAVYMPKFLANLLGLRAASSIINEGTWLGLPTFYKAADTEQTRIKMITIPSQTLVKILQVCRKNEAKLTGALHQIILLALKSKINLPAATSFASQTAVNMRGSIGASDDEMGLFVSGYYENHSRENIPEVVSEAFWQAARQTTTDLAKCSVTLQDQPVGLLRYLPSVRSWTQGKLGQKRDGSYEISNLGAFKPFEAATTNMEVRISKMIFSQPGNVTGAPLTFNVVTVAGGDLVITISWQIGALGAEKEDERDFIDQIGLHVERSLEALN